MRCRAGHVENECGSHCLFFRDKLPFRGVDCLLFRADENERFGVHGEGNAPEYHDVNSLGIALIVS